jgi:hypothetical protein
MENKTEKLNLFFEKIKTISFWQRLFGWTGIRSLSYEAYQEFKALVGTLAQTSKDLDESRGTIGVLRNDVDHLKSAAARMESNIEQLERKLNGAEARVAEFQQENSALRQSEPQRQREHENRISVLTAELDRIRTERSKEQEESKQKEVQRIDLLKQTWAKHQENVRSAMKQICQRHTIEYVDVVPFKGNPDNTIKICDEFVIFDAKSPASDDLQNFPSYIRTQTESVRKYIKEENVRKDIYLVVPSNTAEVLRQFSYNMADYSVYIVTLDVLEPLILSLKRIEEYEFVDQLTPEERENICRLIGKFAHTAKRRIQIDHFFAREFLDVLNKCKAYLPPDILQKVIEFELSEKQNPPQERRAKQILTRDLQADTDMIQKEAEAREIIFPPSLGDDLKSLPLFESDESDSGRNP